MLNIDNKSKIFNFSKFHFEYNIDIYCNTNNFIQRYKKLLFFSLDIVSLIFAFISNFLIIVIEYENFNLIKITGQFQI